MRLATFREPSQPNMLRAAVVTADDRVLDVRHALATLGTDAHIADRDIGILDGAPYTHSWLTHAGLRLLRDLAAAAPAPLYRALDSVRLGPPVPRPGKFIAAGRNYLD